MQIEYRNTLALEDFTRLRAAVGFQPIVAAQAEAGLANSLFTVTACADSQTVGMARVLGDGGYVAVVADVVVLPEYQGQGIGAGLMQRVQAYLQSRAAGGQKLYVYLMARQGKEAFYEKFGFQRRPNNEEGAGMSLWLGV